MWAKVANAFKRTDVDASSSVLPPQHHQENEYTSDSAGEHAKGRGTLLRRGSRLLDNNNKDDNGGGTTKSLNLAKRVKSSLHMNANMNDMGAGAQPVTGSIRSIFGKARRPSVMQVQAALTKSDDALNNNGGESAEDMDMHLPARPSSPSPTNLLQAPSTPPDNNRQNGYGSVRSILRDRNTPGSGQNVRFFSRDAYRVISPNTSLTTNADNTGSSSAEPPLERTTPFMQRIQEMSPDRDGVSGDTTRYLSAGSSPAASSVYASPNSEAFSSQHPTATSTPYLTPEASQAQGAGANMPVPPPQLAAMFEFSPGQEHNVHSIHATANEGSPAFLRDDAVEVDDLGRPVPVQQMQRSASPAASLGSRRTMSDNVNTQPENRVSSHSTASSVSIATPNSLINGSTNSFHSLGGDGGEKHTLSGRAASSLGLHKVFKRESTSSGGKMDFPGPGGGTTTTTSRVRALSERMFNRPSLENKPDTDHANASQTQGADEPDPFSADASNYYNSAAGFPKTPPRVGHVRSDSIMSRNSMNSGHSVSVHSHHSHRSGSGNSRSSGLSAQLPPEEDRDETITALRTQLAFHQELATQYEADIRARDAHAFLMSQKLQAHEAEAERRARAMRGMRKRVAELERAAAVLEDQAERSAAEIFEKAFLDGADGNAVRMLQSRMAELEREKVDLEKREGQAHVEIGRKEEELVKMRDRMEAGGVLDGDMSLDDVQLELVKVRQGATAAVARHQEIELAWAEDRARLVSELESLQKEIASKTCELDMLRSEVEAQWGNTEKLTEKADKLQKGRDEMAKERESLKIEITALERRIADMEVEWTDNENRKAELENELNSVLASKEEVMKEREQLRRQLEHGGYSMNDDSIEQLRAELTSVRREHARMQTDHARSLSEAEVRASDAIELRNETARRQAAAESEARELRNTLAKMQEENEKLEKDIQVLKHQSADQDVKILQLEKQHDRDTEDKLGLNIALDSKQQELELLKRSMGVRGTAGSTPAVPNRTSGGRRDSAAFKTPMPLRPASSLSDGAKRRISLSDTERSNRMVRGTAAKPTFGKGTRPNATSTVKNAPRLSNTSLSAPPGRARSSTASSDSSQKTPRPGVATGAGAGAGARRAMSPNSTVTTTAGRRASIAISGIASMSDSASSARSDKENETPRARPANGGAAGRRASTQPLAVPAPA